MSRNKNDIFENLFVLELANNHWGSIERGKKIVFGNVKFFSYYCMLFN